MAAYTDIRTALDANDQDSIAAAMKGGEYRAVRVARKGNGCYVHSGLIVPATQKGLTAEVMHEMAVLLGDEITIMIVDGLPQNTRIEWEPATETYAVYRDGHGHWLSVAGKVVNDGPFFN